MCPAHDSHMNRPMGTSQRKVVDVSLFDECGSWLALWFLMLCQ